MTSHVFGFAFQKDLSSPHALLSVQLFVVLERLFKAWYCPRVQRTTHYSWSDNLLFFSDTKFHWRLIPDLDDIPYSFEFDSHFFGMLFSPPFTRILTHFRWFRSCVSSSVLIHPLQYSLTAVKTLSDHTCRGKPTSLTPSLRDGCSRLDSTYSWCLPLELQALFLAGPASSDYMFCSFHGGKLKKEALFSNVIDVQTMGLVPVRIISSANLRKGQGVRPIGCNLTIKAPAQGLILR